MNETLFQIRQMIDALTPEERSELIAYTSQFQNESCDEMLDRRKREFESGVVKGVPLDEVFPDLIDKMHTVHDDLLFCTCHLTQ